MSEEDNCVAPVKRRRTTSKVGAAPLALQYPDSLAPFQIGVDEAGRGPMLGRVYAAAVRLSSAPEFHAEWLKDSKKFSSEKRLAEVAEHIKKYCIWAVAYSTEQMIDQINIRQATHQAMISAIKEVVIKCGAQKADDVLALVDGNDFRPVMMPLAPGAEWCALPYVTVEGGDNTYAAIAAASILAKHARDTYVYALVAADPTLDERYGLAGNKGYGSKKHLDGIREHGLSPYHRKTFGLCKEYA